MPLQGFDIANVNGPNIITAALKGDFVICKASEGLTFVDGVHDRFVAALRAAGKLVGHYHYAHVNNSPTSEAQRFLFAAKAQPGDVLALDFEPYNQPVQDSQFAGWILTFTQYVNAATGAHCWVYLNHDMANRAIRAGAQADCDALRTLPLWLASYSTAPGQLHGWPNLTAWQYSDKGIDANTFYGDEAAWRALAVPPKDTKVPPKDTKVTPPVAPPAPKAEEDPMFTPGSQAQLDDAQAKANSAWVVASQTLQEVRDLHTAMVAMQAASVTVEQVQQAVKDAVAASVSVTGTLNVAPKV